MGKKRFNANTEILPSNYDDFFNKVYQDGNKYKDLSDNVFDKTETRKLDFDSHNQDELTGNENPFTSQFGNLNAEDPYNEYRANNQSASEHLGIGAVRTVAKAAIEIAKLPGVIGGIAMSPFAEENEGFETAFNNQWIKFFDGLNEDVKEAMPVYVKESVKNGDFFTKIGSSATWATEGADGAGYMLGALTPGGLFKYFGVAAKMFGASIKAAKYAKYAKTFEGGRKAIKAANITIKNIDQYMIPAFNTIAEAGAESKGAWDGMESRKDEAHKEYMSKLDNNDPRYQTAISLRNEEIDQLRRSGEISLEESQELYKTAHITAAETMFEKDFKEQKALAAQNTFFKNTVWLAGPNYIQAKLLFGKTPSKVLLDKIGGLSEKSIKNTVKQGVKNFAKGFASEGAEEVGQTAVEHRNIEQGLKFKLGDDRGDDYNPLTFGDDFIKTLGTTEGQMAGFLGGIMGGPMSSVGGYFQDKSDRIQTERLREKINGASTAYADIKNTNIYEQEEYTNPETGEVDFRDKEVDGKKVFIPENVAKVKKALDLIEKDSNEYDNAVEDGNVEKIEQFRNRGEFNVIANFIGEDEVTLDALHEHLKVAFPTENTKDISDEQVKVNKTNLERIDKIMKKAKHLQKDFVSFKDMSASILRINHPNITKESTKEEKKKANEHLEDFLNRTAMTFLSERGEEYEAKQVFNKLEQQKSELENNSTKVEIENVDYIEGKTEDIYKQKKVFNNPRLEVVNTLIDKVKEKLEGYEDNTNRKVWDNEYLNKQFAKEVEERKQIQSENSPEQVAKNEEVLNTVGNALENATSVEDVDNAVNLTTGEHLENKITTNVEKIEDLEDRENSLKDELLNIESELSEVINTNNFNLKDELDKIYQDLLVELNENRDELLQQSENLKQLKEQKQLEETNRLKKLKEKNKLEEKKKQDLSKQNKKIEEESKKIKLLEKKILLIQNIGNVVKVNDVTGILNKVNDSIFEVENENEIFEINLENLENLEIEKVKSLKEKYNISKISETSVTVNNIEYKINTDNSGNIISLSPKNNTVQKIKNNELLIAVEIERNKQDFNKRTSVRNIDQRLKDNNYENIANILNTIYNQNLTDTVQSALNNLYSEKELTEQEKLQLGLWVQDAFDRLSNLFNSKNTDLENETLLNSYDNLEIILSLLYNRELKTTTKAFKNDKSNDIGKIEVDVTSERTSKQIESEKQTSKNSEVEKLNKEIENLKSKITDLNSDTEKIIENYETSLKKTESTFISEANPIITKKLQIQAEAKKGEIIETEKAKDAEEIATATQEDNDFNDTTTYSDLNDTEGSPVTDELIPQQGENNSTEELKSIDDETVIVGKGAQVISTHMKTGELFPFVSVDYLKYEREPVNKAGKEVSFEINTNPGPNENLKKALKMLKDKDFSDPAFLISYLPINVVFEKGIVAPMETRRANGKLDVEKDKDGNEQFYINPATKILREQIINHLVNGGSISDIKTTIQDQYKGLLKVDDNRLANNNILELDGVPNLKYVRDNLYVVDSFGNLKNIQTGKTKPFINDKVKSNAKGEIYLEIPQANGKPFPLKLNIKKLDGNEADTLASIYSHILKVKGSSNMTLSEVKDEQLIKDINEHFGQELKVIIPEGKSTKDVKLGEIIDLLVYESDNIKSRINITNDVLYYGENEVTSENIDEKIMEVADFLNQTKRHQIKIEPKFATDNTKTNLKSNSADYLNYLINNNILSTNAVVNEPTFQGYTNIYLNTGVTINNQTQSNIETKKVDIEKRRQEELKGKQFLPVSEFNLKKGDVLYNLYANTEKVSDTFTIKAFSVGGEGMKQYLKAVLFIDNETKAEKWWNSRDKFTWNDLFIKKDTSEINAKYDAELAALNQPKVSDAGVEVNTDNTGITEMFEGASEMGDDVLDILKDFETEPKVENKVLDKIKSFTENKSDIKVKKTIQEIPRENISFFVSGGNGVDHQSFPTNKATSDYDINSTLVKLDGFRYIEHSNNIISFHIPYNGLDVRGGAHLGIAIKGLKLTEIDEKSIKQTIDKLGNALSKISKNVTGDERFDKIKKIGNQVIDTELANLENKSENTRNSQESFVSLSEMKGTMENTELNKTQAEVFNENKNSSSAREDRLLQRAFDVFKKDPNKLSAIQKERLDEYKQKYPEAYKKKCQ